MDEVAKKYGWYISGPYIYNSKGVRVLSYTQSGDKYSFRDMADNKLLSGNKSIEQALECLLVEYYYCKPKTTI